jgi:sorting nexin-1/2
MQLDTEDGETFVPPAGVVASPTTEQHESSNGRSHAQEEEEGPRNDVEQDVPA